MDDPVQSFILAAVKKIRFEIELMIYSGYIEYGSIEQLSRSRERREAYMENLRTLHQNGVELLNDQSKEEYYKWLNTHQSTLEWLAHNTT